MRLLKLAIISIIFFFLLITGISALFPSSINISRAIDISAPADSVYPVLANMRNWNRWYQGYDVVNVPKGDTLFAAKTIVIITRRTRGKVEVNWQTANGDVFRGAFTLIPHTDDITTVQWNLVQKVKWYPWEKFSLIVSSKTIGLSMEQSLDRLKQSVEQQ